MRDLRELAIEQDINEAPTKALGSSLDAFERQFKIRLPEDYRLFLRAYNGGMPRVSAFSVGKRDVRTINAFYFIGRPRKRPPAQDDEWDFENLWDETWIARARIGDFVVPFADEPTGDQLVLDFRDKPASVAVVEHEEGWRLTRVASSFSEFLDMLTELKRK